MRAQYCRVLVRAGDFRGLYCKVACVRASTRDIETKWRRSYDSAGLRCTIYILSFFNIVNIIRSNVSNVVTRFYDTIVVVVLGAAAGM